MVFWKVGRVFCALYLAALVMLRFTRIQEKTAEIQLEKLPKDFQSITTTSQPPFSLSGIPDG